MWQPPENEVGSTRVAPQIEPVAFDPFSKEISGDSESTRSAAGSRTRALEIAAPPAGWTEDPPSLPLEIACPADSSAPLHFADYDVASETIDCVRCGRISTAQLCALLSDELFRFQSAHTALAPVPQVSEDEATVEALALKLFRAFPVESLFAAEAAEALAVQRLEERLSRQHMASCIASAFEKLEAGT
jgi:hypothetical protein